MIAQRLRPIGWVAAVATAAVSLYLVSLRVAAERGALEDVDRQILLTRSDIRRLQTELGTRASMRQLERWNGDVLSLSAPTAAQYMHDGHQLIAYATTGELNPLPRATGPASVRAVVAAEKVAPSEPVLTKAVVTTEPGEESPAPRLTRAAMLQTVAMVRPAPEARPASVSPSRAVAMLDDTTLSDLARRAAREAGAGIR